MLDGELVAWRDGRLDFAALQARLGGARGAHGRQGRVEVCFVVFDVLAVGGEDLRGRPYTRRRARLEGLLAATQPPLAVVPSTDDATAAAAWMREHAAAGIEGVVAKHRDHGYRPRRRHWRKIRTRVTTV